MSGINDDGGSESLRKGLAKLRELQEANLVLTRRNQVLEDQQEKLVAHMESVGLTIQLDDDEKGLEKVTEDLSSSASAPFFQAMFERSSWLSGLLIFQSFSTLILSKNEHILQKHPTVVYFLTALVGAGGNAGNQASVRVIRGLALGTLTPYNIRPFLHREAGMAILLALTVGFVGFVRAMLSPCSGAELVTVVISLMCIVFVSVFVGALLPLLLHAIKVDPAHAATSVQVIMDISGCFLTMFFTRFLLDSELGHYVVGFLVKS